MKKKLSESGFTLVETLGVLVILSIIMLIAIPSLSASTDEMSSSYYKNLEKLLLISAKDYYRDNRSLYPNQVGRRSSVSLDYLVRLKYIEQPKSTRKNNCTGYVEVSMDTSITWKTCLKCDDYQSDDETCDFSNTSGGSNVGSSDSNKSRFLSVPQLEYTVVRDNPFTPPFAELRYGDNTNYEVLRSDIGAIPGYIDTSRIGDYTLNYAFAGTSPIYVTVHVVDVTPPSSVTVSLTKESLSGEVYTTGWTNQDVYQSFNATDDEGGSGIKGYEYSFVNQPNNNSSWTLTTNSYITQKELLEKLGTSSKDFNQTVYVRAVDNHDNRGSVTSYSLSIDQTPPSCTSSGGVETWVNEQTISGTCSDTGSTCLGNVSFSIPGTTNDTVSPGEVSDQAGNKTTCPGVKVMVDKEIPSEVVVSFNGGGNTCSFKNDYDIRLSASDTVSSLDFYEIDTTGDGNSNLTTNGQFVPENGFSSHTVSFRAVDKAGNRGPWSSQYHIHQDTESPTMVRIEAKTTDGATYSSGTLVNQAVKITGVGEDNIGVTGYLYSLDGVTWSTLTDSVTFENMDGTIHVKALDEAGNRSSNEETIHIHSDTIGPSIRVTEEDSTQMKFLVTDDNFASVSVTVSKDGVTNTDKSISNYTSNEFLLSFEEEGDWLIHVRAVDGASNITEQDFHKIISTL